MGTFMPKPENQLRICGKVSITAAQNIHRLNLPFSSIEPCFRSARPASRSATNSATGAALRDPKLQQSGQPGHGQESQSRPDPADVTSTAGIRDDSTDHRDAGPHWSDDVANPVNEVQERAFRLRPGLTLDRNVDLRRSAKILSESHGLAHHQKADCQHRGCYTNVLHFSVDLHRDSAPYRRRALLESLSRIDKFGACENA